MLGKGGMTMLSPDWDSIGCILGAVFLFGLIAVSGVITELQKWFKHVPCRLTISGECVIYSEGIQSGGSILN